MTPIFLRLTLLASAVFMFVGCPNNNSGGGSVTTTAASPTPAPSPSQGMTPVHDGHWGGQGINLDVTSIGGTYELDCAHGTINQQLIADANGNFHATGTIVHEGGPVRASPPPAYPARFDGAIDPEGDDMTLAITDMTTVTPLSAIYHAGFGVNGMLVKCE